MCLQDKPFPLSISLSLFGVCCFSSDAAFGRNRVERADVRLLYIYIYMDYKYCLSQYRNDKPDISLTSTSTPHDSYFEIDRFLHPLFLPFPFRAHGWDLSIFLVGRISLGWCTCSECYTRKPVAETPHGVIHPNFVVINHPRWCNSRLPSYSFHQHVYYSFIVLDIVASTSPIPINSSKVTIEKLIIS